MDTELAIEELEEYLALLQQGKAIVDARRDQFSYLDDPRYQQVSSDLNARILLVEQIFEEVDGVLAARFKSRPRWAWEHANEIEPTESLLGLLRRRDREEEIFGQKGPKLAAAKMHPWIWDSAASLWDGGHFVDAVNRASIDLFDVHLPQKLDIEKVGGPNDRITKAFSSNAPTPNEPRLRFPELAPGTQEWTNAHEGAMFFGKGCAKGIRNVTAHGNQPDEQLALEALAALSLLARWIDEAEVDRV
jgi:hypothetical protein